MRWKLLWYLFVAIAFIATFFFDFSWPQNWRAALSALGPIETWWGAHAGHPILSAFFAGLLLGTVLLPELWLQLRPHLFPAKPRPNLDAGIAFKTILVRSREAKRFARKKENLKPTRDQGWYPKMHEQLFSEAEQINQRLKSHFDMRIHDLLRQGQIVAWGRPGRDMPEQEIRAEEWSYMALDFDRKTLENSLPIVHAWKHPNARGMHRFAYANIRFSSIQFYNEFPLSIWSRRKAHANPLRFGVSEIPIPTGNELQGTIEQEKSIQSDPTKIERKNFVSRAFLGFGEAEIEWLDRMNISGRPHGCPDAIWMTLERSGLVERDFTGPRGIKEELRSAVANALSEWKTLQNALEIIIEPSSKYRRTQQYPNGTVTETLSVGLRNSHPTRRITNCKISIRLPESVPAYAHCWLLKDGISLEGGEERIVDVFFFHEFKQKTPERLDHIRICVPPTGTFAQPPELPIEPNIVSLEAESTETDLRDIRCRIWLDESRHLQFEPTS